MVLVLFFGCWGFGKFLVHYGRGLVADKAGKTLHTRHDPLKTLDPKP